MGSAGPDQTFGEESPVTKRIWIEQLALKPIEDSQDPETAYCVVVDGRRSPLYFNRRQAEEAIAAALEQTAYSN